MVSDIDRALRPTTFADFTGQTKVVNRLKLACTAARQRGEPVEHIVLHGPPGCLHRSTMIYDPVKRDHKTVEQRWREGIDFHVWTLRGGRVVIGKAESPWKYPAARIVALTFASGRVLRVTLGHRVFDGRQFVSVEQLLSSADIRLPSISEHALRVHAPSVRRYWGTTRDSRSDYLEGFCSDDEQLHRASASGQDAAPSEGDAPPRSPLGFSADDLLPSHIDIRHKQMTRHAKRDYVARLGRPIENGSIFHCREESGGSSPGWIQTLERSRQHCFPDDKIEPPQRRDRESKLSIFSCNQCIMDRLVSVEEIGLDEYFDFHVQGDENYWAEGFFHHNTGKTSLAAIVANEMGGKLITVAAPTLQTPLDAQALMLSVRFCDVLFLDEIHRLKRDIEEYLYSALEDFEIDYMDPAGGGGHTGLRPKLLPHTVIGATTQFGKLTAPMRMRFGIDLELDFYNPEELGRIIQRSADKLAVKIEPGAVELLASRSRGTPRIANRLVRRARDYAQVSRRGVIDLEGLEIVLVTEGIDDKGLGDLDREYLRALREIYGGGPAGIRAIAASIDRDADTLVETVEPFLLRQGVIARTPRGRILAGNVTKRDETLPEPAYL